MYNYSMTNFAYLLSKTVQYFTGQMVRQELLRDENTSGPIADQSEAWRVVIDHGVHSLVY